METTWINGGVLLAALLSYPASALIISVVNAFRARRRRSIFASRGAR